MKITKLVRDALFHLLDTHGWLEDMENSPELNLDELSPEQLAQITSQSQNSLGIFFRHIVGIVGAYEHIDANGVRKPQTPFFYSSAVLQIDEQWYLATAGHNLEKLEALVSLPNTDLVACGLDDTYAPGIRDPSPIQHFDFVSAQRFHKNSDGVDFGLIHLRQNYRDLLSANGVRPLSEQHWDSDGIDQSTHFWMVGFPEDSIDAGITRGVTHYNASVKGRGTVIQIDRQHPSPEAIANPEHQRFVGQIRAEHDVGSIVGMSGGPIFCFKGPDFDPYYVAALQSTWIPEKKRTFGCPIPMILKESRNFLASIR